ncbi:MAG TPA: 30S ribosomal protein S12 methylthiotransferase RimO, partial [Rhodospirillaceae bacterium]|nr:30S ribosomal protein S12 methylthiotransferase RimO [Rhodospirillaceae bacterium]
HYVYPYPHVDKLVPLMADGLVLPYLDIPFQHASPNVLNLMRRPAHQEKTMTRINAWRAICPDITLRSTFIVGFPGETDADFDFLLDWLKEAQLDRVGCFKYENVDGAAANDLPDHVPEDVKEDRWHRFMAAQAEISAAKLQKKIGLEMQVLVDQAQGDDGYTTARSTADAPEIDGNVHIEGPGAETFQPGDLVTVQITDADDYDLYGEVVTT